MEKYSVLMSVYALDKPEYLIQSLDSMINQTVKPDEIVLVEDGPLTDGLYEVIKIYRDSFADMMTIVSLEKNGGLGNALNFGIRAARNELVARMDADDISLPDRCRMQMEAFRRMPELSIVGTQMDEFADSPQRIVSSRVVPSSYKEILRFSRRRSPFNHPTVMYRKSDVIRTGGYAVCGRKQDLELFVRMLYEGYKAINLRKSYLLYRADQNNLKRRKSWTNCREYIKIMCNFHRKGYNSKADMIYIVTGQMVMYFAPEYLAGKLSSKFLRQ